MHIARAPPDPPSPMITEMTGTGARASAMRSAEIAHACPRSSPPRPAKAPGVSRALDALIGGEVGVDAPLGGLEGLLEARDLRLQAPAGTREPVQLGDAL